MTKEEAIKILHSAIKKPNTKDGYLGQALDMAINALEQESVLDKIRAEIEELDGEWIPFWDVVEIIDKYRAESETQE